VTEKAPLYTRLEAALADRLGAFLNPRMGAWLVLTILLGAALWYVGRAAAIGSLAVTAFNMSALGYLGYRAANALERGRRPHALFAEAERQRIAAAESCEAERGEWLERAWQLEQLANSMLVRRVTLVSACVLGATFMKF
jgi:hypothetical protein